MVLQRQRGSLDRGSGVRAPFTTVSQTEVPYSRIVQHPVAVQVDAAAAPRVQEAPQQLPQQQGCVWVAARGRRCVSRLGTALARATSAAAASAAATSAVAASTAATSIAAAVAIAAAAGGPSAAELQANRPVTNVSPRVLRELLTSHRTTRTTVLASAIIGFRQLRVLT